MSPLLRVRDLQVAFEHRDSTVAVVRAVDLDVEPGEIVALVGESGSGKTTVVNALIGLADSSARVTGRAELLGVDLLALDDDELRRRRGAQIGFVFQNPMNALNPSHRIARQIVDTLIAHGRGSRAEAGQRAIQLLAEVGLPQPEVQARRYPHELSGGMRQRVMIAIAIACDPQLILADEPTTALDSTIQAQILDLLADLRERRGAAVLLVSHDLGVVGEVAQKVVVMYAGEIVESGPTAGVLTAPRHPYTRGLLSASPRLEGARRPRLHTIPGAAPAPGTTDSGCAFRARCPLALPECAQPQPLLPRRDGTGWHRCWRAEDTFREPIDWGAAA